MPEKRNPWIAAALSFLVWGTGQIYNGKIQKGMALLLCDVVLSASYIAMAFMQISSNIVIDAFNLIVLTIFTIVWLWNILDAYKGK